MGSAASKNTEEEEEDDCSNGGGGGQLYVSLKMENSKVQGELTPHIYGSVPVIGLLFSYQVYEPVEEGSYIKMIDMVSGNGGQIQVNNISGYLPGRIVFFLVNTHLTPRPILLTRHGESMDNVRGRTGGDSVIRSRRKDKLRYRYPRGESYLDVIQRPVKPTRELE
ncbi:unnamed protein product [Eruca vesicaria subsp. sativa]|uniref:6-phosphofructo-2-kinase domain-containing protein n=1 Tax=Eruca vesicaria subsp. sativa TaxID=29727 RepID=A0ABC8K1I5_ERUVS|nr:unnamed protein product [Eruca vesicaria subsp. sativa]